MSKKSPIKTSILLVLSYTLLIFTSQILVGIITLFAFLSLNISITNSVPMLFTILLFSSLLSTLVFVKILPNFKLKSLSLKVTREEAGLSGLPTWKDIGLSIVGFMAVNILSMIVLSIASLSKAVDVNQPQNIGISHLSNTLDIFFAFISVVILPAFFEELFFRGIMYGKIRSILSFWPSAIITSIAFGLLHGQLNVAIVTFIMGIVACFMREITGTIYASILLHLAKNGLAFYLLFFLSSIYQ